MLADNQDARNGLPGRRPNFPVLARNAAYQRKLMAIYDLLRQRI
jgi:hypothetical protein